MSIIRWTFGCFLALLTSSAICAPANYMVIRWDIAPLQVVGSSTTPVDYNARLLDFDGSKISLEITSSPPPPGPGVWYTVMGGQKRMLPPSGLYNGSHVGIKNVQSRAGDLSLHTIVIMDAPASIILYQDNDETGADSVNLNETAMAVVVDNSTPMTWNGVVTNTGSSALFSGLPVLALPDNSYITWCHNDMRSAFSEFWKIGFTLCRDVSSAPVNGGTPFKTGNHNYHAICSVMAWASDSCNIRDKFLSSPELWHVRSF